MNFTKMHGLGNDFIVIDEEVPVESAIQWCDRKFGVGADGVITVLSEPDPEMIVINSDGSIPEMCGNGLRVAADYLFERNPATENPLKIKTGAGVLEVERLSDGQIRVDMGVAELHPKKIGMNVEGDRFLDALISKTLQGSAVSMGNPHLILFVDDLDQIDLHRDGPILENHPLFPSRTNVHFVNVVSRTHLMQLTWERGAGATLACGTGACSALVAAVETGRADRKATVQLPGGVLEIEYLTSGHVLMTGPAAKSYSGRLSCSA